jgi:hypothetical protein
MRTVLLALLCFSSVTAAAQSRAPDPLMLAQAPTGKPADKKAGDKAKDEKPAADEKPKPRPRVTIKKDGSVGDDAPGGGARSGASSMGGTPGTPSGSFTRP